MRCGTNLLCLIILLFLAGNEHVNGFTTLVPIASSNPAPVNPTAPVKQSFQLNAARRHRANATNAETANPTLRGIRQYNVGQKLRTWIESYEALIEYKRMHQHCRVPFMYSLDRPLGKWVCELRSKGREALSLEKLELLDKAGFDWETKDERNNRLWQESYQKLVDYNEEHGDCCVPQKYELDKALGKWVSDQRSYRKQERLRMDRRRLLDAIGFVWSVKNGSKHKDTESADRLWNGTFDRLLEFREEWGHCLVPQVFDEDPSFGIWVRDQRVLFKRELLRPDRKKRLEEIEFVFEPSNSDQNLDDLHWNLMLRRLVDYKATHGDTDVKKRYEEFGLGIWVQTQRRTKSIMDEQRRKQLDAIGFNWSAPRNKLWQDRFEELREYSKMHATCKVKKKDNLLLAQWVFHQRSKIKNGKLSEPKIKQLQSIGFT